jgi:hypothetical protein
MSILRAKIRWTVPGAGAAYSVLHFGQKTGDPVTVAMADELLNRVDIFCSAIRPYLPQQVTVQALSEVEVLTQTTGAMESVVTGASKTVKTGSATAGASWSAPAGAVITWNTSVVVRGRRVRGRTFLVPLSSTAFDTDGTLNSTALGGIGTAATDLRTSGTLTELIVFCRPTTPGGTDGTGGVVQSHRVPDMGAVLRSRRS